jgi:hypothetical protein
MDKRQTPMPPEAGSCTAVETASCDFIRFSDAGGDHSVILEGFATIYWVTLLDSIVSIGLFHDAGQVNILVKRSCGIGALSVQWFSSPCLGM